MVLGFVAFGLNGCVDLDLLLPDAKYAWTEATKICDDYRSNNIAANKKWIGQYVRTRGEILSISQSRTGSDLIVSVSDTSTNKSFFAFYFKPTEENLKEIYTLKSGQYITLLGQINQILTSKQTSPTPNDSSCSVIVDPSSFY